MNERAANVNTLPRIKVYRVEFFKELKDEYACKRVVCVPLILPNSAEVSIRGAVFLYFKTPKIGLRYPVKVLDIMGRLSEIRDAGYSVYVTGHSDRKGRHTRDRDSHVSIRLESDGAAEVFESKKARLI